MATTIHFQDLLPSIFNTTVAEYTDSRLLPVEREGTLLALLNSVRWSVHRRGGEPVWDSQIVTGDRFSDEWMSRTEIVERIENSSGLDSAMSAFALWLIESRVDSIIAKDEAILVGLGRIRRTESPVERAPLALPFERIPDLLFDDRELGPWRQRPAPHVRRLLQFAETSVAFRPALPYRITLSDNFMFKEDTRKPISMELFATPDHHFSWKRRTSRHDFREWVFKWLDALWARRER